MKFNIFYLVATVSIALFLTAGGCNSLDSKDDNGTIDNGTTTNNNITVDISDQEYELPTVEGGNGSFTITADLGSTPVDYLLMFTNTGLDLGNSPLQVSSQQPSEFNQQEFQSDSLEHILEDLDSQISGAQTLTDYAREQGIGIRGIPEATKFNANPPPFGKKMPFPSRSVAYETPQYSTYTVHDTTHDFYYNTSDTIKATVRYSQVIDSVQLNIWVANNAYTGCSKAACMTSDQVSAFAGKFLQEGADNDIYDWVVNIFGAPWGSHSNSKLIDATADSKIDILFFDIGSDNSTTGGVLGYFWAKDNHKESDGSNERLIFYMDSVLAAQKEGGSWDISDPWPAEIVSTLAHEFQHMIHFYQKTVLRTTDSESWLNEMCSMVAEDFLADKMLVNGPRGVDYNDGSAGAASNNKGRLPRYVYYPNYKFIEWPKDDIANILKSYAISYSFGAYLARNFGGAPFFRDLVHNEYGDHRAVTQALRARGYSGENFTTALRKWGVAAYLSYKTDTPEGYRYNKGGYFISTIGSITYHLGSINMHNYCFDSKCGIKTWTPGQLSGLTTQYGTSNVFVLVGEDVTGTQTHTVSMQAGVKVAAIKK